MTANGKDKNGPLGRGHDVSCPYGWERRDSYLRASSGEATLDSEAQVMSKGMKGVTASG